MPSITFISHDGTEQQVEAENGISVMQTALDNDIEGIAADCGGACSCGTCHCYVDEAWVEKTGAAGEIEEQILEFAIEPKANSRLSCQLVVQDDLDGLVVHLPESQY